jgi:hypothetical protein
VADGLARRRDHRRQRFGGQHHAHR